MAAPLPFACGAAVYHRRMKRDASHLLPSRGAADCMPRGTAHTTWDLRSTSIGLWSYSSRRAFLPDAYYQATGTLPLARYHSMIMLGRVAEFTI
jgi:hypothetical protein